MKKKLLLGISALICCCTIFNVYASALNEKVYSWYCVRQKDHKQPSADADMQWILDYHGYYVDTTHKDDCGEKVVYLTFDAGYENGNVAKILDILKHEQIPAAFFILGHLIQKNPDLVVRMAEEGHTVCNHTNRHPDMTRITQFEDFQKELQELETLYRDTVGSEIARFYRPPEGKFNERSLEYADRMGYKTIFWSLAYADWDNAKQPAIEAAKKKILDNVHNGAVILLHPTSQTNAMILEDVIQELKTQGYRFGTLHELVTNLEAAQ